jgi:hypothetical protein
MNVIIVAIAMPMSWAPAVCLMPKLCEGKMEALRNQVGSQLVVCNHLKRKAMQTEQRKKV